MNHIKLFTPSVLYQKHIVLCRTLILVALIGSFMITLINNIVTKGSLWDIEVFIIIPLLLALLWINEKGYYQLAGLILSISLPIMILSINIINKVHVQTPIYVFEYISPRFLLLITLSIPFLIFDIQRDKYFLYISLLTNALCILLIDTLGSYYGVGILIDPSQEAQYTYFKYILMISWCVLSFSFWMLKYINHQYETQLNYANHELKSKQEEIQCQNEELTQQSEQIKLINEEISDREQQTRSQNLTLEQEVARQTKELKAINKELDLFLYRSSHDLRRPLTTLMGLSEVARVNSDPSLALDLLEKVDFTAHQMDKMLTKLRMVSDINGDSIEFDNVKLRKIIQHQQRSFQKELKSLHIDIRIDYDPTMKVWSNDTLLNAIFSNLLENAIQFSRQREPFIHITIKQDNGYLWVEFTDNGQGIEDKYLGQIFDMYFRANEYAKGNGLGLYVVRKSLEKLKGSIKVSSVYGESTKFNIKIPTTPTTSER